MTSQEGRGGVGEVLIAGDRQCSSLKGGDESSHCLGDPNQRLLPFHGPGELGEGRGGREGVEKCRVPVEERCQLMCDPP